MGYPVQTCFLYANHLKCSHNNWRVMFYVNISLGKLFHFSEMWYPILDCLQWFSVYRVSTKLSLVGCEYEIFIYPLYWYNMRRDWREGRATNLLPLWAFVACSRVTFTFYWYNTGCPKKIVPFFIYFFKKIQSFSDTCIFLWQRDSLPS